MSIAEWVTPTKEETTDNVISAIKKCLDMHEYDSLGYMPYAINRIAARWYEAKQELITLLRKHPDWDEERLAVVTAVTIEDGESIEEYVNTSQNIISAYIYDSFDFVNQSYLDTPKLRVHSKEFMQENFHKLNVNGHSVWLTPDGYLATELTFEFCDTDVYDPTSKNIPGQPLREIEGVTKEGKRIPVVFSPFMFTEWQPKQKINYDLLFSLRMPPTDKLQNTTNLFKKVDSKIRRTSKMSRCYNKMFSTVGIDKLQDFNKLFAKFSDTLNSRKSDEVAVLSVHPCDYLNMSYGNSWNSCHDIRYDSEGTGCYSSGTISYMLDSTSMVFYTLGSKDYTGQTLWRQPKHNRQMFCWGEGILLQSRLYPNDADKTKINVFGDCVRNSILYPLLDTQEKWQALNNRYGVKNGDATLYADFEHQPEKVNYYRLKVEGVPKLSASSVNIGSAPICLCCGEDHEVTDSLYCEGCTPDLDKPIYCSNCGEWEAMEGSDYCSDCYDEIFGEDDE